MSSCRIICHPAMKNDSSAIREKRAHQNRPRCAANDPLKPPDRSELESRANSLSACSRN
jgi:hypothetical protein